LHEFGDALAHALAPKLALVVVIDVAADIVRIYSLMACVID
jgi:hypothetical protein